MRYPQGIRPHGRGKWRVRASKRTEDGRIEIDRIVTGDLEDAKDELRKVQDELAARLAGESRDRLTLSAYAQRWLRRKAATIKPSTAAKYVTDLELHILPALGARKLEELRPRHVADYLAQDQGSANNRRNRLALLRQIAADALADGYTDVDFAARVRAPVARSSYTEEEPNLLTPEQMGAVLDAIPEQWRCVASLLALTGLRWGEVSGLRWDDVDLSRGTITIRRTNWKGDTHGPKTTAAWRVVALTEPLPAVLAAHRRAQIAKQHPGLRSGLVFPTRKGTLHRGSPLLKVLRKACKDAGVPRVTSHGLGRRTWNDIGRKLADRMVVRAIIGHTSEQMTEHYSVVTIDEKRAAARAVAATIPGLAGILGGEKGVTRTPRDKKDE